MRKMKKNADRQSNAKELKMKSSPKIMQLTTLNIMMKRTTSTFKVVVTDPNIVNQREEEKLKLTLQMEL